MDEHGKIHIGMGTKWARIHRGLTCAAVAEELECDRSWLYRVESGSHSPAYDFVERAASLFGFEIEDMRCGLIAERLNSLTASQKEGIRKRLDKLNVENKDATRYASKGIRLPSLTILRAIADSLNMSVGELVYGDTARVSAE